MPLHAIETRRLYRQIADQIRAGVRSGEYPPGSRLPAERDLALQLGVSRPSVREALIALEVEGLVEVRVGSGVHVLGDADAAAKSARVIGNASGPFEIIRARQVVEGELAALAAQRMTKLQITGLREILRRMDEDIAAGSMPIHSDRQFHLCVAEAADNAPLLRTVTELYDERNNPLFESFGHHFENARTWRMALVEHQAVVDAIAARDVDGARRAMQRHLQRSHDRYARMAVEARRDGTRGTAPRASAGTGTRGAAARANPRHSASRKHTA